ncbi:hypothetical protein RhiirA4_394081 [Rhizophagus irregularis]|uniref:Uncharacterized protein n=1 Tax=Rhizophagus irregularis TaxID=588596 RepID=A0A2I1G008_9GLOM|nr:hypothetical protein RhiirA4_394081 [Rhizophagus irregularis]
MEIQDIDELLDEAFPNIKENEKSHIKWLLQSFNPVPLECQMLLAKRGWECLENPATMEGRMKADIVGVRLSYNRQVVFLKMSGAPTDFLNVHTMGDTYKKVQERVDLLNSVLLNFLNYDGSIALHSDLFF